jgi:hypothetical protein
VGFHWYCRVFKGLFVGTTTDSQGNSSLSKNVVKHLFYDLDIWKTYDCTCEKRQRPMQRKNRHDLGMTSWIQRLHWEMPFNAMHDIVFSLYVWLMILKSIISPSNRVDLWIFMVDIFIATWDNINQQPVGLQLLPKEQKKERPATLRAWHRTEVEDVSWENRGTTYLYNWTKLEHMIYKFFFHLGFCSMGTSNHLWTRSKGAIVHCQNGWRGIPWYILRNPALGVRKLHTYPFNLAVFKTLAGWCCKGL